MGHAAHGLGRLQPRIPHTHGPVPLAQPVPVRTHPKRSVRHLRWLRIAEGAVQKPLKRRTVLQIPAAHNMRHSLIHIVHHYGQLVGPGAVGATQYHCIVGIAQAPRTRTVKRPSAVRTGPGIGPHEASVGRRNRLFHIASGAAAGKDQSLGGQVCEGLRVAGSALGLRRHLFVPV